jgi:mono/diheme cytochrome c family protein
MTAALVPRTTSGQQMNKLLIAGGAALVIAAGVFAMQTGQAPAETTPQPPEQGAPLANVTVPETLSERAQLGQVAFEATCAACHGENAAGKMGFGPPLVHKVYEPSHHGDMAFVIAAERGVRQHHWPFGDMPPQQGLTRADMAGIITYVRELQRANGIN